MGRYERSVSSTRPLLGIVLDQGIFQPSEFTPAPTDVPTSTLTPTLVLTHTPTPTPLPISCTSCEARAINCDVVGNDGFVCQEDLDEMTLYYNQNYPPYDFAGGTQDFDESCKKPDGTINILDISYCSACLDCPTQTD